MTAARVTAGRDRVAAIRLRPRSMAAVAIASVAGLVAFVWPFLIPPSSRFASEGSTATLVLALLLPVLLGIVLAEISEGGIDVKALAMLGVLSAVGAVLRPIGAGTAGLETVFFLLVLGGRVFGPGFGFVLGTTTLFASALVTAGIGPWLPFQMIGAAWVGLGAGLLPPARGRAEIALLAAYGLVAGLLYGFLLNLTFWPFATQGEAAISFVPGAPVVDNLRRYLAFDLATSLGWDVGRALTNVVLVVATARPVLAALRRAGRRAAFDAPVEFVD